MGKPFYDQQPTQQPVQQPSAPTLTEMARNESSYVDFIILGNKENYSVRADRLSILNSNTNLAKLVQTDKLHINHGNVNPNNFEALIRFIETNFIRFTDDAKNTLNILELASMFQCQALEIACVKDLDLKLSVDNVIDVYKALRYCNTSNALTITSAPKPQAAEEHLNAMYYNTLQFMDQHAADVLIKPEMLELRFEELEIVIKRDALQIPAETLIFDLLADWSSRECERKALEPSEENRRRVLGGLIYMPRYLNMSHEEFKKCRDRINLLDPAEVQLIENFFTKKKNSNLAAEQILMLENFKKPRFPFALMPIHLSNRSNSKNYSKKMRNFTEKQQKGDDVNGCLLNCVSVLSCIFE